MSYKNPHTRLNKESRASFEEDTELGRNVIDATAQPLPGDVAESFLQTATKHAMHGPPRPNFKACLKLLGAFSNFHRDNHIW